MLVLYLCFAPQFAREAEARYQYKMRYCRNPHAHWSAIRDEQAKIKSSPTEMKPLLEQVQFELNGNAVLEQDFSGD